ncbi:MAG TPA: DUF1674 domain-containing protein [Beijerinckiaceae bacterium]|nr:DUF1674 domain-containing protein [Beijerinckiaceae bacterium]
MNDAQGTRSLSSVAVEGGERSARRLSPAAQRALAEAAARRAEIDARAAALPPEHGARREREPVRYGDWEAKGIASDF